MGGDASEHDVALLLVECFRVEARHQHQGWPVLEWPVLVPVLHDRCGLTRGEIECVIDLPGGRRVDLDLDADGATGSDEEFKAMVLP